MKIKNILTIILSLLIFYFVVTSYPVQMGWWMFMDFTNPKLTEQTKTKYMTESNQFLLRKLDDKVYVRVGIAANILQQRNEPKAIPILIKKLKSSNDEIRQEAISTLCYWGNKDGIEAVQNIVKQGRTHKDYNDALYYLSQIHNDQVYADILKNAYDGYETSLVVGMLEQFPEKPETLPALKKIAEQDPEAYVREKAKIALEKINK